MTEKCTTMVDISANTVEIYISFDSSKVWINTENGCAVRINDIRNLTIDDNREIKQNTPFSKDILNLIDNNTLIDSEDLRKQLVSLKDEIDDQLLSIGMDDNEYSKALSYLKALEDIGKYFDIEL